MTLTVQSAFRLPAELLERIDAFAARLTASHQVQVTRTDAVRILLAAGLGELEFQYPPAAPTTTTKKTKAKKK